MNELQRLRVLVKRADTWPMTGEANLYRWIDEVHHLLPGILDRISVAEARALRLQAERVELRALLLECSTALDYMEDRGYSSIRYLRSKVRVALSDALVAPGGTETKL